MLLDFGTDYSGGDDECLKLFIFHSDDQVSQRDFYCVRGKYTCISVCFSNNSLLSREPFAVTSTKRKRIPVSATVGKNLAHIASVVTPQRRRLHQSLYFLHQNLLFQSRHIPL